jgi:hypothetical protein
LKRFFDIDASAFYGKEYAEWRRFVDRM